MTTYSTDLSKAKALVRFLIKKGHALTIDNGGGCEFPPTTDAAFVCKKLMSTGHDFLHCSKNGKIAQVYLVYNDEPENLIADYHTSLDAIIEAFEDGVTA